MHVLRLTSLLLFICVLASFTTGWARAEDADNESGADADGGDGDEVDEDDVVVLTKDNFDKVVKDTEYVLVRSHSRVRHVVSELARHEGRVAPKARAVA